MSLLDAFRGAAPTQVAAIDAEIAELSVALPDMKGRLHELVVECVVNDNYAPARELGQQIRSAEDRIAALTAERADALTAEQRRLEVERQKEAQRFVKAARARLGELTMARRELDSAIADIANWSRRADATLDSLVALMPSVSWPPGAAQLFADAVEQAVSVAVTGVDAPSIEAAIGPLYAAIQTQIANRE